MKRFKSILCASLLTLAMSSATMAGNITLNRSGNITLNTAGMASPGGVDRYSRLLGAGGAEQFVGEAP